MRKLNAAQCKTITKPGFYRADDTLYLYVKPTGRKSWVQRIVVDRRRVNLGLGPFPVVTLAEARDQALDNRRLVRNGKHPLVEKRRVQMPIFKDAAVDTYESLKPTWKSRVTERMWLQPIEKYAIPVIGNLSVDRITEDHLLAILKPIWTQKPEQSRRVKRRIRAILDWCSEHRYVQQNVAAKQFRHSLPAMPKVKRNYRALDYREMPEAVKTIESGLTSLPTKLCLLFLIYTAARSGEARGATWKEIDLETATWVIPKERMKSDRPHRVPLSKSALAVLEEASHLRDGSGLVFPSPANPGGPISDNWTKPLIQIGLHGKATVHGFRSSFKTWAMDRTDIPHEVCEMALAHNVGDAVVRAYSRSDLLEKRVVLMQQWDGFLGGSIIEN